MTDWIGTALRRLRDERLSALGLAVFVFVTAFAAAAAPRLVDRMATDALLATVARELPAARNIQWQREARIGSIDSSSLDTVDGISDVLHALLPEPPGGPCLGSLVVRGLRALDAAGGRGRSGDHAPPGAARR